MFEKTLAVLLASALLVGCDRQEAQKTEPAPVERNVTINNPPPAPVAPAQNTTTVIHDRTVVHDVATAPPATAAPAGNVIINNTNNPTPSP